MRTLLDCVTLLFCVSGLVLTSALTSSDECLNVHENKKLIIFNGSSLDRMVSSASDCLQWCYQVGPKSCAAYEYNSASGLCQLYNGLQLGKMQLVAEPGTIFVEVLGKCGDGKADDRSKREATGGQAYATWGPWGAWTACTATCGGGQQTRTRQCSVYGACGYGGNSGVQACNAQPCCTEWSQWGKCSVTCGTGGTQSRERRCPIYGNTYQSKPETATQPCQGYMPPCATWADWAPWGACSVTCGKGQSARERQCTGGNSCVGDAKGAQDCDKGPCPSWAEWGPWGPCSVTCGKGQSTRDRTCTGGAAGKDCPGDAKGVQDCDKGPCYTWSSWSEWSECTVLCGGGSRNRTRQCPQDGGCSGLSDSSDVCNMMPCPDWGDWSPWSDCTVTCGGGSRSRTRSCPLPKACSPGEEFEADATCGSGTCPTWSDWTEWGACTKTCGEGNRKRSRKCSQGDGCLGSAENVEPCFVKACTLSTEWSQWSPCTATCGGGTQTRSRVKCPAGPPTCPIEEGTQACNPQACPGWAEWGAWGQCSKSCGGGQRTRTRTCPVTNGCVGAANDIDPTPCNAQGCNTAADVKTKGKAAPEKGSGKGTATKAKAN